MLGFLTESNKKNFWLGNAEVFCLTLVNGSIDQVLKAQMRSNRAWGVKKHYVQLLCNERTLDTCSNDD